MGANRTLSRLQLAWRLAATVIVVVLVTCGSVRGADKYWPFAPMSQFAFAVSPQGDVVSTYVEADTTAGTTVRVPLSASGVGLGRAEVEGQLPRIIHDPRLLGAIAQAAANLHPGWPRYERLRLKQTITVLTNGVPSSTYTKILGVYDMPPSFYEPRA